METGRKRERLFVCVCERERMRERQKGREIKREREKERKSVPAAPSGPQRSMPRMQACIRPAPVRADLYFLVTNMIAASPLLTTGKCVV